MRAREETIRTFMWQVYGKDATTFTVHLHQCQSYWQNVQLAVPDPPIFTCFILKNKCFCFLLNSNL